MRKLDFQRGKLLQDCRRRWRLASKAWRGVDFGGGAADAPWPEIARATKTISRRRIFGTIALVKVDWKKVTAPRNSAKALIVKDGRLLVIRKKVGAELWYLLPGGGQEKGETLHEALKRECLEEVNAVIEPGRLLFVREYLGRNHEFADSQADAHAVDFMFEAFLKEGSVPSQGSQPDWSQEGIAWLPIQELETHELYPRALRARLAELFDGQGFAAPVDPYAGDVN